MVILKSQARPGQIFFLYTTSSPPTPPQIHTYTHTCDDTLTHTFDDIHMHTHIHTLAHTLVRTQIHTHSHAYISILVRTQTHAHTQHKNNNKERNSIRKVSQIICLHK